jgi:hypothetical protein
MAGYFSMCFYLGVFGREIATVWWELGTGLTRKFQHVFISLGFWPRE